MIEKILLLVWYLLSANILLLNKIPIREILEKCSDIANQLFRI